MSFFNKKEEVMEIRLTPYGKFQLMSGRFKPAYYAFSDDEILYDISYGESKDESGFEPLQRIQDGAVRLRPIVDHDSAETRVREITSLHSPNNFHEDVCTELFGNRMGGRGLMERGDGQLGSTGGLLEEDPVALQSVRYFRGRNINFSPVDNIYIEDITQWHATQPGVASNYALDIQRHHAKDDRYLVRNLLGHSDVGNDLTPSWNIVSLSNTEFKSPVYMSSSGPNIGMKRPRIEIEIDYDLTAFPGGVNTSLSDWRRSRPNPMAKQHYFLDGMTLKIDDDFILLDVKEENVPYDKTNFEIEFFIVDDIREEVIDRNAATASYAETEWLTRLYCSDNPDAADESEIDNYFEINFDEQIPQHEISPPKFNEIYDTAERPRPGDHCDD